MGTPFSMSWLVRNRLRSRFAASRMFTTKSASPLSK